MLALVVHTPPGERALYAGEEKQLLARGICQCTLGVNQTLKGYIWLIEIENQICVLLVQRQFIPL